jgi:parallel beta-helix repeat protein
MATVIILAFLFLAASGVQSLNLAVANFLSTPSPQTVLTINSDGSIDPSEVPISRNGSMYTLTDNIGGYEVHIECPNIVFDGAGFRISGNGFGTGLTVENVAMNVTIKNLEIKSFSYCIYVGSSNNVVAGNYISNTPVGICVGGNFNNVTGNILGYDRSSNTLGYCATGISVDAPFNTVTGNTFINKGDGISLYSNNNTFLNNNFVNNRASVCLMVWLKGGDGSGNSFTANYWSDYNGTDADGDGVGDTPYAVYESVNDLYPLIKPLNMTSTIDQLLAIASTPSPIPSISAATLPPSTEPSASTSASEQPTQTPTPQSPAFSTELIYAAAAIAIIAVITITAVALKRRKKQ